MPTTPLDLIWQRDLSRPRYRRPDNSVTPFAEKKPREYGWICDLLRGFTLRHHPDDQFEVDAPSPIVVLDGDHYDPDEVRHYLRRLTQANSAVGLIHIADEFHHAPLDIYDEAAFVYRNYWRSGMEAYDHCRYLPLGANCPLDAFSPRTFSERTYRWSFAGQAKGPREAMIEQVSERPDGFLSVNEDFNSGLPKDAYAQLLCDSKVVLCPRGFRAAESYRFYEALEAGAIPLVEDDGGLGLLWEHARPSTAWTALTGGTAYWYDLARRSRKPSYWHSAYGSDFPCPRIYRWENVDPILERLDGASLADTIHTWWSTYKSTLRGRLTTDIHQHLSSGPSMQIYTNGHSEEPHRH